MTTTHDKPLSPAFGTEINIIERPDAIQAQPAGPAPTCERECLKCHANYESAMVWHLAGRWIPYGNECPDCAVQRQQRTMKGSDKAKEEYWKSLIPAGYIPQREKIPEELKLRVRRGLEEQPGKGMVIHGRKGTWKTSVMFHVVCRRLIWNGFRPMFMNAMTFRRLASEHSQKGTLSEWLREIQSTPWLFLDDFGNMADSGAASESLHDLLEYRRGRMLPLLVTTQFSETSDLLARFKNRHQGEAIAERMRALCPIRIKSDLEDLLL